MSKKQNSFAKTWDVLSPAVIYYAVYNIAFILLVYMVSAFLNGMNGEKALADMNGNATVAAIVNGAAMLIGIVPLLPMLRKQLVGCKKSGLLQYIITVVIAFSSSVAFNIFMTLTGLTESSASYTQVADRQYGIAFGLGIFLYGVVSPLAEEVVFRGLIYNRMKKYYPTALSAVISAVIFGVWHGNLIQAVYGSVMGLLLAYIYERFGSFAIPCLFHAAANIAVYTITCHDIFYNVLIKPYVCIVLLAVAAGGILYIEKGLSVHITKAS